MLHLENLEKLEFKSKYSTISRDQWEEICLQLPVGLKELSLKRF